MGDAEDRRELVTKLKAHVASMTGLPGDDADAWRRMFAAYDVNADGLMDASEVERLFQNAGVGNAFTRGTWVSRVMSALNADRDAGVSLTELMAAVAAGKPPPATGEPDVALPIQSTASMRPQAPVSVSVNASSLSFWGPLLAGALVGLLLRAVVRGYVREGFP